MGGLILLMLGALALSVIAAVMFGPDEKVDDVVTVGGRPLAIEAKSCQRVRPVEPVHTWDEIDQAWGEARWMMEVG